MRLFLALLLALAPAGEIRFSYQPIAFTLDSDESAARRVPETMAGGVAVFDFNNDGALDIFFANGADLRTLRKTGEKHWNRLFSNDGRGHFTDVTARAGLAGTGFDNSVAVADYNNDGYQDIFVGGVHHSTLYRNNGDGTFTDVTAKAGIATGDNWAVAAAWVDVNNDGYLDLFIVNYLAWSISTEPPCEYRGVREYCHPKFYKAASNQLYINNHDGTFTDASVSSGIRAHPGKGMGVAVADYDLDGRMDIFVTNDSLPNSLFHNLGNGRFEEVALNAGVALVEAGAYISGMGTDFRDVDNDGYPDIALVALDRETFPLFHNTGHGDFIDVTTRSRMGPLSLAMAGYSPTIFDFDNDGWKDIFVTRGHVQAEGAARAIVAEQQNTVFRNLGQGRFEAITLGGQPPRRHRGSAVGDLNGDGRLDVVTTSIGGPAEIWINDSPGTNHWLELRLEGTHCTRDAIGARIKVVTKAGAQYNHVTSASGYASSSAGPVHFGLGADTAAALVEIRWPCGKQQTLKDVAADRVLSVKEPK